MGCCGNKPCDRPKEAIVRSDALLSLVGEGSWVLNKLLEIAKGGSRFVGFKSAGVNELAATISAIVAENNYLKKLLGTTDKNTVKATDAGVTISFGPRGEYSLFIAAVTNETRTQLADSLCRAANELKSTTPDLPEQKWLPFVDCA